MQYFYFSFSSLIVWLLVAIGLLCLVISFKVKHHPDIGFGLLGLAFIVLFLTPPEESSLLHNLEQTPIIKFVRRLSVFLYFLSTAWFVLKIATGDKSKLVAYTLGLCSATFLVVLVTDIYDRIEVLFLLMCGATITGILVLGVRAATWLYHQKYSSEKVRMMVALLSGYQLLFLFIILLRLVNVSATGDYTLESLFPSAWFLVFSLTMMALVITMAFERLKVERIFKLNEKRFQAVMENAPMLVLELDRDGRISYINDFGVNLLGFNDANEVLNLNWFNTFLLPSDIALLSKLHTEILNGTVPTANFKNTVRRKTGEEIMINWVNFVAENQDTKTPRIISIGRDISSEESANKLVAKMQKELEKENLSMAETTHFELEENVVGKSRAFMYAVQRARQVAVTHAPVLLEGETGVGKEVFANLIHKNSSRSTMPFIKVNCGALPKELIEDELFGHEKGAFTSAIQARKGRFELADNGTIFLDEIGELPHDMQPKLLRVLQNGEFERVGGQKTIKVDVRILAATNRNLMDEITHGNFREDLYYRLNVFPITIPALRNRKEDLPDLIQYFIATKSKEYRKTLEQISTADMERLLGYRWPGNIRELKNVIERAVIVSEGRVLKLDWWYNPDFVGDSGGNLALDRVERDHILIVLGNCHWKINGANGAAEVLNMHPNTLRSKMKRLGISRPEVKDAGEIMDSSGYIPNGSMG